MLMRDNVRNILCHPNAKPMYLFPYLPFEAHQTRIEHDWQDEMGKNDS